jgi:hypothetical protein
MTKAKDWRADKLNMLASSMLSASRRIVLMRLRPCAYLPSINGLKLPRRAV